MLIYVAARRLKSESQLEGAASPGSLSKGIRVWDPTPFLIPRTAKQLRSVGVVKSTGGLSMGKRFNLPPLAAASHHVVDLSGIEPPLLVVNKREVPQVSVGDLVGRVLRCAPLASMRQGSGLPLTWRGAWALCHATYAKRGPADASKPLIVCMMPP